MKILLIGEYSNVYNTLAQGLRQLGHYVKLASNGDGWKNYKRDIDLAAPNSKKLVQLLLKNFYHFTGFDIVLIINPLFLFSGSSSIHLNKYIFDFLKTFNKKVYLSAIGDDYYWVKACLDNKFIYSPFTRITNFDNLDGHYKRAYELINPKIEFITKYILNNVEGIIAGLYEYYLPYEQSDYKDKLTFVPFPINLDAIPFQIPENKSNKKIVFFIGIQDKRNDWKGTDIILPILEYFADNYSNNVELKIVRSVPYYEYEKYINESDIVIDQLFSYSPAMNGLLAMAKGKILMGGGEEEHYKMLNETENRPIINIIPDEKQIYSSLEYLLDNKSRLNDMKLKSRKYMEKHHNYIKVAKSYLDYWQE